MADELSLGERKLVQSLLESKNEDASFMGWVTKKEEGKTDRRILVIASNKIFAIKAGKPGPKEEAHYLDLVEIKSSNSSELNLTFKTFKFFATTNAADQIIDCIRKAAAASFPGVPEKDRYRIEVQPESRLQEIPDVELPLEGFLATYKSLCVKDGTEPVSDIIWDLENLYVPQPKLRNFNLREFEQNMSASELRPLVGTLQYNNYFRYFSAIDYDLDKGTLQTLSEAFKFNKKIEEITLSRVSMDATSVALLSEALSFNKTLSLTSIDISGNNIGDKGLQSFAAYLGGMGRGLVKLNVSSCGGSKVGMTALFKSLKDNVHMSSSLTFFDVAHNKMENDGSSPLAVFLSSPNALKKLNISSTNANVDVIMGALIRGSSEMVTLDLSHNKLLKKDSLVKYAQSAGSLKSMNLTDIGLTPEIAGAIVQAMSSNPYLSDCSLNLTDNKLGVAGAKKIASLADKIVNLSSIDLSENDFGDEGIHSIAEAFSRNTYTKTLILDRNYKGKAKGSRCTAVDGLIDLINSESPIDTLSISGGKAFAFGSDLYLFIQALAKNKKIVTLDISGNALGNKGIQMLGKALQSNTTLVTLKIDNNNTSTVGFEGLIFGLKRNTTVKNLPSPVNDISSSLKEGKQLTDAVATIEKILIRNQTPDAKYQDEQEGGVSQGKRGDLAFLRSGEREKVQKLLFKIKALGKKASDEGQVAIDDAENQDNVMVNIFELQDEMNYQFEENLKQKLASNASTVTPIFGNLKSLLIGKVMTTIQKSYHCLDDDVVKRLKTVLEYGAKDLEIEDVRRILVDSATSQLEVKAQQGFFSLVSIASDYLFEKVQLKLTDVVDQITLELQQEHDHREEEEREKELKAKGQAPQAKKPTPKPAAKEKEEKKPKAATPKQSTASKVPSKVEPEPAKEPEPKVHVEELEKSDKVIKEHATRDRPVQSGKRPPTRKPRAKHEDS